MKKIALLLLCVASTSASQPAAAWRLGQPLSELRDQDIGKGLANLGQAAADVITLGETARQRDEARAREDKERAEQAHQEMIARQNEKKEQIKKEISSVEQSIQFLNLQRQSLDLLTQSLFSNQKTTALLVTALETQSVEFDVLRELIRSQHADLAKWVQLMRSAAESTDTNTMAESVRTEFLPMQRSLSEKVSLYVDQIEKMPRQEGEVTDTSLMEEVIESGFEALELSKILVAKIDDQIASHKARLPQLQSDLQQLN
ncbi:MAG: hypothetical protein NDI61_05445 [Bdellovibrionaceae bacterium]|nr:hypothetical protein [Pseudobdellovibrionaceae bacterium]